MAALHIEVPEHINARVSKADANQNESFASVFGNA
jgi:hypothetical protein|tara:strand:+ start:348 stop:452 length:105 start_codon:yes stop_codon:yes gene_type:complete